MRRTAKPIYPNAGVENWYREQLERIVRAMSQDLLALVREAWRDGGGIAQDGYNRTAAGVIFRCDGLILLLKRADGTGWGFPGGGVEPGETPEIAARREVGEELSCQYDGQLLIHCVQPYYSIRFVTFIADLTSMSDLIPVLNEEHTEYRWVTVDYALRVMNLHPGVMQTLGGMVEPRPWPNIDYALRVSAGIVEDAKRKPSTPLLLQRSMSKWGLKWGTRLEKASLKIATEFATKSKNATTVAMMRQLKTAGFTVKFTADKLTQQAYSAVVAENVGLIKSIPQKYLGDVQNAVWQNVMQGSDLATLADDIQEKYGISHRRAALIARDQNHKAKAAIERARRLDVGITAAIWRHSRGGKVPRHTHKYVMNGNEYPVAEGMWDPAVKKYIWPGTEVNCGCVDEPVIPGFN